MRDSERRERVGLMGADNLVPREFCSGNRKHLVSVALEYWGEHNWDLLLFLFMLIVQFSTDPISNCIKTELLTSDISTRIYDIFFGNYFNIEVVEKKTN